MTATNALATTSDRAVRWIPVIMAALARAWFDFSIAVAILVAAVLSVTSVEEIATDLLALSASDWQQLLPVTLALFVFVRGLRTLATAKLL